MALNAWNNAGDKPARLAHLDDRNDRAVLLQGSEGPTQSVELLCHGTLHRRCFQRRWCHLATARPIASRFVICLVAYSISARRAAATEMIAPTESAQSGLRPLTTRKTDVPTVIATASQVAA